MVLHLLGELSGSFLKKSILWPFSPMYMFAISIEVCPVYLAFVFFIKKIGLWGFCSLLCKDTTKQCLSALSLKYRLYSEQTFMWYWSKTLVGKQCFMKWKSAPPKVYWYLCLEFKTVFWRGRIKKSQTKDYILVFPLQLLCSWDWLDLQL